MIFNPSDKKNIQNLATAGINPFAQFANPFGEAGFISGMMSFGQTSPYIQATISAMGIDPYDGTQVQISPEAGVTEDMVGRLWDTKTGKPLDSIGQVEGGPRFLAGLLRTAPQYRSLERLLAGGNPVYPENVPFLHDRPIAVDKDKRKTGQGLLTDMFGTSPKKYDFGTKKRGFLKEGREFAEKKNKRQLKKTRKKLAK